MMYGCFPDGNIIEYIEPSLNNYAKGKQKESNKNIGFFFI